MKAGSNLTVVAAVGGNTLVMSCKFVAFYFTGSGVMLSEGIHSVADVLNQVLLLIGIWASRRRPNEQYPYGYQPERFVWAMISAVGIFFLGGGVTAYHGVHSIGHPEPISNPLWAYGVLGVAFVIEGAVLVIAIHSVRTNARAAGRPFGSFIRREADPTNVAVLLEDGVAVTGVVVAGAAISLSHWTGNPIFDGIGSLVIAALLTMAALILVAQNRRLLIGAAVPKRVQEKVTKIVGSHPAVEAIYDFKSRVLSVDSYRVKMEVEFDGRAIARKLDREMRRGYHHATGSYEEFEEFCEGFAEQVIDTLGDEIDAIEERIRSEVKGVRHVDIEAD